jgi:hypothetical protein
MAALAVGNWQCLAANKHNLTEVVTGALLGAAFGEAVPLLLHEKVGERRALFL